MSTNKNKARAGMAAASAHASPDPSNYRINPEVEAKIDNPHQGEPETFGLTCKVCPATVWSAPVVLNEVRQLERQGADAR